MANSPEVSSATDFSERYVRSMNLSRLILQAKKLLELNETRYAHIVNTSERREDCPYAKQAARLSDGERDTLLGVLRGMDDLICGVITSLTEHPTETPNEEGV